MRLRGAGMGAGTAIGTAAVVRVLSGIPLPPEIPPRIMQQMASGRNSEMPDVIVVAEDFRTALAVVSTISWANVVGIAAVRPESRPSPFPAVLGIPNLLEVVADDMLLLLDATQGVLLADPDPRAIAQYQAEAEHIAPKRRLFLEDVHLPAQTLDGRTIQVVAIVQNLEEVETAMANGADALYVPFDRMPPDGFILPAGYHLLPANADEETLRENLFALIEAAAGKPLIISDDYSLPLMALLEAASRADVTVAVPPRDDLEGLGIAELRTELEAALLECEENETVCSLPRLAADFTKLSGNEAEQIAALIANGAERIVISLESQAGFLADILPALDTLITGSAASLVPAFLRVNAWQESFEPLETSVCYAAGTGAAGLLVSAEKTAETKALIRELNFEECRERILQRLNTEDSA